MAGVDAVVSFLLKSVSHILVQEVKSIRDARDQLELFRGQLEFINEFLRDSAGKRDKVKEVVKQIKEVALDAEDLIGDFVMKMAKHQRRNTLQKFFHCGEKMKLLRNVCAEIERIKNKIKHIYENRDMYNITSNELVVTSEELERHWIQRRRRRVEEDEVVGFNNDAELVMEKLDTSDSRRDVVSIIGMGGLGKTTLAKKIYNNTSVKKSFDCRAWVDVSQDYNPKDLLVKITESIFPSMKTNKSEERTEEKLMQKLASKLTEKRYFIVLDDVWTKDLWDGIKEAFPDNRKRSRVLITSRFKDVALHASVRTPPYEPPHLEEDDSWNLFSKKVFDDQVFPPRLEQLARKQILPQCKGLPLAIVVAAGLLRNREESMWSKVASDLTYFLKQDPKECLGILALSYDDLPPHLKPCFLYFGVYPEDFDIPVRELIRLWCAEGFVDQETSNNLDMEEIAEDYLLQLIDRSLIQVVSRRSDGGVKSCRVHDLLRDLTILEGELENFLVAGIKVDRSSIAPNKLIRRLSVYHGTRAIKCDSLSVSQYSHLRSLLSFHNDCFVSPAHVFKDPFTTFISMSCRYLRVLHIASILGFEIHLGPKKLVQLRYLRMNMRWHREYKLENLQTLALEGFQEEGTLKFSGNHCETQQLRHLLLPTNSPTRFYIPKGNDNSAFPNLRTLSNLRIMDENDVNMLKMLPNLKKLKVVCRNNQLEVFEYLSKLERLQTLNIRDRFKFTNPGALPSSLTKITLSQSGLDTSAFTKLGGLPNLQVLKLGYWSLLGTKIECYQWQFPRLQVLHIHDLRDIEWWSMEGQGLQSLVYLSIDSCPRLKSIPYQLKKLSTLRQLKITGDCYRGFMESLKQTWVSDRRLHFKLALNLFCFLLPIIMESEHLYSHFCT